MSWESPSPRRGSTAGGGRTARAPELGAPPENPWGWETPFLGRGSASSHEEKATGPHQSPQQGQGEVTALSTPRNPSQIPFTSNPIQHPLCPFLRVSPGPINIIN